MDITLSMDLSRMERRFGALVAAAADPQTALLRIGGKVRSNARRAFDQQGPGWDALDPETQRRKITGAEIAVLGSRVKGRSVASRILSTARQMERAFERSDTAPTEKQRANWERKLKVLTDNADVYEMAYQSRRLSSFSAILEFIEKDRARAKYHRDNQQVARKQFKAGEIDEKERARTAARGKRRYLAQGNADRLLGNLDKSISIALETRRVRIFSHARIGGIHNVGGTAGNGAKIPARPFMFLRPSDGDVFAEIVQEEMIGAFLEAA